MAKPLDQMVLVYPAKDEAFEHASQVGAVVVNFTNTFYAGRMTILAALDPSVAANLEILPKLERLGCRIDMPSGVTVPLAADAVASAPPSELLKLVVAGGWDHLDLLLDPATGRGLFSGLTLGEMAMCRPPQGWSEGRANLFPWDMAGWQMPGSAHGGSWKAPQLAAKPGHGRYVVAFEGEQLASAPSAQPAAPVAKPSAAPAAPAAQPAVAVEGPFVPDMLATLEAARAAGGDAAAAVETLIAANHDGTAGAFQAAAAVYLARRAEGASAPKAQITAAIRNAVASYPEPLKAAVFAILPHIPSPSGA